MKYKTKLIFLISLISICVFILVASFIFNPQNTNARKSLYTWLEKTWTLQVDRIVLKGSGFASEPIMLIRKLDRWFVRANEIDYPAKQELTADLLNLLSTRTAYPVRATSQSSHERLGVTEQLASRIIVYGGASQIPLLDLFVGSGNLAGSEIYLRKNGSNEVRSGADQFTHFSDAKQNAWFDLKLFSDEKMLTTNMIQQVCVFKNDSSQHSSYVLSRYVDEGRTSWKIDSLQTANIDNTKVESFLRTLLTSEAADFAAYLSDDDFTFGNIEFNFGEIELLLDDLSRINISIAPALANNQYPAIMSGNPFVFLIPEWTVERMFREAEYFSP
jgi:hypothetical protein